MDRVTLNDIVGAPKTWQVFLAADGDVPDATDGLPIRFFGFAFNWAKVVAARSCVISARHDPSDTYTVSTAGVVSYANTLLAGGNGVYWPEGFDVAFTGIGQAGDMILAFWLPA